MKKVYIVVLVLAVCLGLYVFLPRISNAPTKGTSQSAPSQNTSLPVTGDVTLAIGQKGQVGDLSLVWNKPIEDSRCPAGVQCIWAGDVRVNVTMSLAGYSETTNLSTTNAGFLFDGHAVSITSVTPTLDQSSVISPQDYRITFHVEAR